MPANEKPKIEPCYRKLGKVIAERRGAANLSQEQLAHKIGLSRTALINMEAGRQRIYLHHLLAVERVLKCPRGRLFMLAVGKSKG